jgi:hypothetical protein
MELTTISFLTTDTPTTDRKIDVLRLRTKDFFAVMDSPLRGLSGDVGKEFTTISFLTTDTPMTDNPQQT